MLRSGAGIQHQQAAAPSLGHHHVEHALPPPVCRRRARTTTSAAGSSSHTAAPRLSQALLQLLLHQPAYTVRRTVRAHAAGSQQRGGRSTISRSILSVLKDEQKYAAESYRKDEELLDDPPNGFELDSPAGKRSAYLLKEHHGEEQIIVELDMDEQGDAQDEAAEQGGEGSEDEDDQEELPAVSFRVQVVKESGLLTFQCLSNGQYVTITDLALQSEEASSSEQQQRRRRGSDHDGEEQEDGDGEDEDGGQYVGPPFEELDDTLQQAFLDFLEERGVTAELGRYLQKLLADKCATEYQAWLHRMRDFIAH